MSETAKTRGNRRVSVHGAIDAREYGVPEVVDIAMSHPGSY